MISIREQSYGLNVALYNEFTLEDFRELEQAILQAVGRVHRPDLLTRTHPKYFDTAAEAQAWLLGE